MPNPTVHPTVSFEALKDAEALHKAMKGLGTNEKTLIAVMCHRSNDQRQAIKEAFITCYGKELKSELKKELSGDFERLMLALLTPWADFMAKEIHDAVDGAGTNEKKLIEILCSSTNQEIRRITAAYEQLHSKGIEAAIKGDVSGDFKRLLICLLQAQRCEEEIHISAEAAAEDADRLLKAGEDKRGTDECEFISILSSRSFAHLNRVSDDYERLRGHSLKEAIKAEFSGSIATALITILQCAKNRPAFFAECLHHTMVGLGTRDRDLIRIIVSRSEIDLANVRNEYENKYNKTLASDVKKDTSGDYRETLLALIG